MGSQQNILAVIPARGGSKGIPRKNVRTLCGRPLLAYSIDHALGSPSVNRVVVSTDDPEIAQVTENCGAEVVWRPAEFSTDAASSECALVHALQHLQERDQYTPDVVVFLQATSPVRRSEHVEEALQTLNEQALDSLFSASPLNGFVWRMEDSGPRAMTYDYRRRLRRQDAPEDLIENGSFYAFKPWVLAQYNNRLGGRVGVYRMDAMYSFQIDEPADFELIEHLMARHLAVTSDPQFGRVKLLVLDFDGVMTDNRVLVNERGEESVFCDRRDGWGLAQLRKAGVEIYVLSTETNPVVAARSKKLGLQYLHGCDDKLAHLQRLAEERRLQPEEIAYVGNDVNDLACMNWVGLPIAVADGMPMVRERAKFITRQRGGHGAVREVADRMLAEIATR